MTSQNSSVGKKSIFYENQQNNSKNNLKNNVRSNNKNNTDYLKYMDKLIKDMKKLTIIVIRLSNGELHESRPCNACLEMIRRYMIKHVYYSTKNNIIYERSSEMTFQHTALYYRRKYRS